MKTQIVEAKHLMPFFFLGFVVAAISQLNLVALGIIGVVTKQNGITVQGCYKTLVQILGFDKVAASTRKILDEALESLIHNKRIERRVDNLYLIV